VTGGAAAEPGRLSIADAARAMRAGDLTPQELTDACLARIAEVDGTLHAFATVTADLARRQAAAAAAELPADPEGHRPLLGIPIGVKDLVDVAGVPTRAGSRARPHAPAVADAAVWRRLADGGAVLIGKTTTHELAYGVTTPPARNPHDVDRVPGGSSGGSAVALAAGMCLGAVGTDTAGSIRIPAGLCGVVGHKPTWGRCPTDGILPLSPTLDHVGPMARSAGDAALLFATMADAPQHDAPVAVAGLRIGLATTDVLWTDDVRAAFDRAATALEAAGAQLTPVAVPSFHQAVRHADRIITVEAGVEHADLLATAGDRLTAATRAKLQAATRIDGPTYVRALRHRAEVRRGLDAALGAHDVLLTPGVAVPAPRVGAAQVRVGGLDQRVGRALCWNTAAADLAGLPAVALPAGTGDDGLPVGVQVLGPAGRDAWLLAVATAVAAVLTGGATPPLVAPCS
jgi:aspartyl-tRNA(Asn)/glutamyl-tRNA(Gln) amidotransferase subunit A